MMNPKIFAEGLARTLYFQTTPKNQMEKFLQIMINDHIQALREIGKIYSQSLSGTAQARTTLLLIKVSRQ